MFILFVNMRKSFFRFLRSIQLYFSICYRFNGYLIYSNLSRQFLLGLDIIKGKFPVHFFIGSTMSGTLLDCSFCYRRNRLSIEIYNFCTLLSFKFYGFFTLFQRLRTLLLVMFNYELNISHLRNRIFILNSTALTAISEQSLVLNEILLIYFYFMKFRIMVFGFFEA